MVKMFKWLTNSFSKSMSLSDDSSHASSVYSKRTLSVSRSRSNEEVATAGVASDQILTTGSMKMSEGLLGKKEFVELMIRDTVTSDLLASFLNEIYYLEGDALNDSRCVFFQQFDQSVTRASRRSSFLEASGQFTIKTFVHELRSILDALKNINQTGRSLISTEQEFRMLCLYIFWRSDSFTSVCGYSPSKANQPISSGTTASPDFAILADFQNRSLEVDLWYLQPDDLIKVSSDEWHVKATKRVVNMLFVGKRQKEFDFCESPNGLMVMHAGRLLTLDALMVLMRSRFSTTEQDSFLSSSGSSSKFKRPNKSVRNSILVIGNEIRFLSGQT